MFCDRRIHPYIKSILFVSISFTVTSTKLWKSNYSSYQEGLFDKISKLKDNVFTPLNFKEISDLLNNEGYITPRGTVFKNNHVFSIYKKGMIRKERIERKDEVVVLDTLVQVCYPKIKYY